MKLRREKPLVLFSITMLEISELEQIAKARVEDAETLLKKKRYDGAIYLVGYAIEMALKARVCKTLLGRKKYPQNAKEFKDLSSLKTHNLDLLLRLSGREKKVKRTYMTEWSIVNQWKPESRYMPIGSASKSDVALMIQSAKCLLGVL